ncbi:TraM recognition domain-containing protein [Branchiibius hedensis]|uniref:TraM recognition domain-containing protein n=1 Tax=Branchiibius hedensis TaxID=672460 RepID=UPI0026CEF188
MGCLRDAEALVLGQREGLRGGVSEEDFLDKLSKLIGDYDKLTSSISAGKGYRSTSRQLTRERILDVEQLAALPKGRAVVLSSGNRAAMIRTKPWMNGPHAHDVRASITLNDPNGAATIADAFTQLRQVDQQEGNTDEHH